MLPPWIALRVTSFYQGNRGTSWAWKPLRNHNISLFPRETRANEMKIFRESPVKQPAAKPYHIYERVHHSPSNYLTWHSQFDYLSAPHMRDEGFDGDRSSNALDSVQTR